MRINLAPINLLIFLLSASAIHASQGSPPEDPATGAAAAGSPAQAKGPPIHAASAEAKRTALPATVSPEQLVDAATDDLLVLTLEEQQYRELGAGIPLSDAQQYYVDERFRTYRRSLSELRNRLGQDLRPLGLAIINLSSEERREQPAVLHEAAIAIQRALGEAKPRMVGALQAFESDCLEILSEGQRVRWNDGMRAWRRSRMLDYWSAGSGAARDLGRHADLIELAENLSEANSGVAQWLRDIGTREDALTDRAEEAAGEPDLRARLRGQFNSYALELDALLTTHFWSGWEDKLQARADAMVGDHEAVERTRKRALRRWLVIYEFNQRTARAVASLLEEAGCPDCAGAWTSAVEHRYFPQLFADTSVDLAYRWLIEPGRVDDATRASIAHIYEEFRSVRATLRQAVKQRLLDLVANDSITPGRIGLLRRTGRLPQIDTLADRHRDLTEQTLRSFAFVLTEAQRAAFELAVERFHQEGIDGEALEY